MKFDRNTMYILLQSQFQTTFTIGKVKIECCFSCLGLLIVGRSTYNYIKVHAINLLQTKENLFKAFLRKWS